MKIDIYCANWRCPICNGQLKHDELWYETRCLNGCYSIDKFDSYQDRFRIFENEFILARGDYPNKWQRAQKIIDEIKYWKKNDRYLIKILSG
jgi:hypothetical protein